MADLRITFTRREAGAYVHAATGVEIHRGESGRWFVYDMTRQEGAKLVAARPTKALAEVVAAESVRRILAQRAAKAERDAADQALRDADHAKALIEAAERIVAADGEDALVHRATPISNRFSGVSSWVSDCGVDLLTTPYTFGSPLRPDATCPACIARFAPIRL